MPDRGAHRHHFTPNRREREFERVEYYQYWHSHMNDGTDKGFDNWPYYKEYLAYKEWYDQIEDKSLHTLKVAVAQLLDDFDTKDYVLYEGNEKTKKTQLESLLAKIIGEEKLIDEEEELRRPLK